MRESFRTLNENICALLKERQKPETSMATIYTPAGNHPDPTVSRGYAWVVFTLTFGLLLSDYMSRQVLNAVFPVLKVEWLLSDTKLASLNSIVALLVGTLTFPLSLIADRWGRVKSVALMALLWSVATAGCALAANYNEMLIARFMVGVGEAAYGAVGLALILNVFPTRMRSSLTAAFMAGGPVGSVLGMALGGVIAKQLGWRFAFGGMAGFGLVLVVLYIAFVRENKIRPQQATDGAHPKNQIAPIPGLRATFKALVSSRSVLAAYFGSGFQLFIFGALLAWLPSYFSRYYAMDTQKAGVTAAGFLLVCSIGMTVCGIITDRLCRNNAERKWTVAMIYSGLSAVLIFIGFHTPVGPQQMLLIALGMLTVASVTGPVGAMVANLTNPAIHATAFATLTLINNLVGFAPGAFLTGVLSDRLNSLQQALEIIPLISIASVLVFAYGKRHYAKDLQRIHALHD
jgi:MFS family permease